MASAQSLLRLARNHVDEQYFLGQFVPKDNPEWRGPWDCAEFASWCVFQTTRTLFGCRPRTNPATSDAYSGFWMEDVTRLGKPISIAQAAATPGAFLVRAPTVGVAGHVVICAGNGKTVEAHSTKRGVIESVTAGRRWDTGVLVPGIVTSVAVAPPPQPRPALVLRVKTPPMTGELVRLVQRKLKDRGFRPGRVDGEYGPHTAAAVQAFQLAKGLLPDGEVGEKTAKALGVEWV